MKGESFDLKFDFDSLIHKKKGFKHIEYEISRSKNSYPRYPLNPFSEERRFWKNLSKSLKGKSSNRSKIIPLD